MPHRPPAVIAADLDTAIDNLPTSFMPSGVRDALNLTREFCAAVAALIEQASSEPPPPNAAEKLTIAP